MKRLFSGMLLAACALTATACSQTTETTRATLRSREAPERAFAVPAPGGPAVIVVSERLYSNAIEQYIALATRAAVPGQNFLSVQFFGPMGLDAGASRLSNRPFIESDIAREMRSALPGVPMARSPLYVQNSYGPFGYAFGRRGDDLCFYGWQRIAHTPERPGVTVGAIQLRLRVCETGATEQSLLALMYGLTINAAMSSRGWNPYGDPPPPDPRWGRTGEPILPVGADGNLTLVSAQPAPTPSPRPARAPVAARPEIPAPPPGAPMVPPPPGMASPDQAVPVIPPPP